MPAQVSYVTHWFPMKKMLLGIEIWVNQKDKGQVSGRQELPGNGSFELTMTLDHCKIEANVKSLQGRQSRGGIDFPGFPLSRE